MLAIRSLPPPFLLPAWSTRQLAGVQVSLQQRARKSDDSRGSRSVFGIDRSKGKGSIIPRGNKLQAAGRKEEKSHDHTPSLFEELFPEEVVKKTATEQRTVEPDRPSAAKTKKSASDGNTQSLFELLFPEETSKKGSVEVEKEKLGKLPAFNWTKDRPDAATEERKGRTTTRTFDVRDRAPAVSGEPSVLVLNSSRSLEESDFFRVSPQGKHIEGWTTGIIKVIPGRDSTTLRPLGYYFILFTDPAAAHAYLDHSFRLWRLAQSKDQLSSSGISNLPLPPGILRVGEDVKKMLNGFTLTTAWNKLSLREVAKPYRPAMQRILKEGGAAAMVAKGRVGDMVLVSSNDGYIGYTDLMAAIKIDGRTRNLHWRLAGDGDNVVTLDEAQDDEDDEEMMERRNRKKKPDLRTNSRYVLSFEDRDEARRFVREWHKRPIPRNKNRRPGQELPPVINAEVLW